MTGFIMPDKKIPAQNLLRRTRGKKRANVHFPSTHQWI